MTSSAIRKIFYEFRDFSVIFFRAFRRGKISEKSGTSKIFEYCTRNHVITNLLSTQKNVFPKIIVERPCLKKKLHFMSETVTLLRVFTEASFEYFVLLFQIFECFDHKRNSIQTKRKLILFE